MIDCNNDAGGSLHLRFRSQLEAVISWQGVVVVIVVLVIINIIIVVGHWAAAIGLNR